MFELLLLIYLLPLIAIVALLLKLVIWLVRAVFRLALWLVKKTFVLLGKGLLLAFAFIVGNRRTSAGNYTDGSNDKSRTNTMTDTASMEHGLSFSLYVERLFLFRLKAFSFASLIYHLSSRIAICNTELDGTTDRDVFGQLHDKS
jgi:conserved domain protein